MFSGRLVNKYSGTSKKGNEFYTVDIFVNVGDDRRVCFKTFLNASVYDKVSAIPLDTLVSVKCGVNDFGNLCVTDITPITK